MDRHLCLALAVLFTVCFFHCFANIINEHELVILAGHLSDEECRELILVLYKKPAYELTQSNRYTGDCDHDLNKWLQSKEEDGDSLALEEAHHALIELDRPALAQQLTMEAYKETEHNLEEYIDSDGLLIDKDLNSKDRHTDD